MSDVINFNNIGNNSSLAFRSNDYLVSYDPHNPAHERGFVSLLLEQAGEHGRKFSSRDLKPSVFSAAQEFDVNFVCGQLGNAHSAIKGMTTTFPADYAGGKFMFLEDLIVTKDARRQGVGQLLTCNALIKAWEDGYNGFGWHVGRDNHIAQAFYKSIDAQCDFSIPHEVWRFSSKKFEDLTRNESVIDTARLAVPRDLNDISDTLRTRKKDCKDLFYISETLNVQQHNGINASSFIVVSADGSFAFCSKAYSTFAGQRRADVKLYLSQNAEQDDVAALMKAIGKETARRKNWRGAVYIEFGNEPIKQDPPIRRAEENLIGAASAVFKRLGAELVQHDGQSMVPYYFVGESYVSAVLKATKRLPGRLSEGAYARLKVAAFQYGHN